MPNAFGKSIDKTYLSVNNAEKRGFIHRDYIAHCLRWSHVIKYLQQKQRYKTARILDLGCGREIPLLTTLYSSKMLPELYVGVDYGPMFLLDSLSKHLNDKIILYPETNILNITNYHAGASNIIVMFEALEHMEKDMGCEVLAHIASLMTPLTTFFISTPCYDGVNKAGNHVYEWTHDELKEELEKYFIIHNHWGTFASMKDYKHLMSTHQFEMFNLLTDYYDVNLVSCIFAPLFPAQSRNCIWELSLLTK